MSLKETPKDAKKERTSDELRVLEEKVNSRLNKMEKDIKEYGDRVQYSMGFYDGRKYIVSQAERIMLKETGCTTREELLTSGKMPSFWISTLVLCLEDPPRVLDLGEVEVK